MTWIFIHGRADRSAILSPTARSCGQRLRPSHSIPGHALLSGFVRAHHPRRRSIPRPVADARLLLALSTILVVWVVALVFISQSWLVLLLGLLAPVLTMTVYRRRLHRAASDSSVPVDGLAELPFQVTVVCLALYGMTLFVLSQVDYQRNQTSYERKLGQYELRAVGRTDETLDFVSIAQRGPSGRVRPSRQEQHAISELRRDVRRFSEPAQRLRVIQSQHLATIGIVGEYVLIIERDARAELADPEPRSPNPSALPRWFGQLKGFFTVAAQLLGAIVLVLVFTRWRAGTSEAAFRTVLPVEVAGLLAALVANLPLLSRQFQAVLLAPRHRRSGGRARGARRHRCLSAGEVVHRGRLPPNGDSRRPILADAEPSWRRRAHRPSSTAERAEGRECPRRPIPDCFRESRGLSR